MVRKNKTRGKGMKKCSFCKRSEGEVDFLFPSHDECEWICGECAQVAKKALEMSADTETLLGKTAPKRTGGFSKGVIGSLKKCHLRVVK